MRIFERNRKEFQKIFFIFEMRLTSSTKHVDKRGGGGCSDDHNTQ